MNPILKISNLSKQYRLGVVGTGTISHDINRWWAKIRGKDDPFLTIGDTNVRDTKGESKYVWALKDINFEVMPGEVLGIIGKNGAGKSTLLKILSQVTGPTTGSIKSRGRIASLLEVGTGFHPELTGKENIYLNGAILGMTKKEINSKIDEIVAFSGVARYIDTPVKRYSSGMTVRLAFAVAAHLEPDILVIDEVLAVGDAEFQKKAIGKMQDISRGEGRTVLFVSHNMAAVKNLCTRGIVLEDGKSVFEGETDDAIEFYLKKYTSIKIGVFKTSNREGNGLVKIENIDIFGNKRKNYITAGEELNIQINTNSINKVLLKQIQCDIGIDNAQGNRIYWMSTSLMEFSNKELNSEFTMITFEQNKCFLNKGIYTLTLFLSINGEVSDWIKKAITFEVQEGDFYNTGKLPPKNQGDILTDFRISVL